MTEAKGLHSTLVVNCVLNSFLSSTAILLNIITIQALRKTPSLSKPLKTLLLSLAVSDLGVGFLVQPTYVAVLVMKIKQNADNRTYDTIFDAFYVQNFLFVFASFFGVFALTVDRFLAIHLHLRYQELVTHKRVVAVVSSVSLLLVCYLPIFCTGVARIHGKTPLLLLYLSLVIPLCIWIHLSIRWSTVGRWEIFVKLSRTHYKASFPVVPE